MKRLWIVVCVSGILACGMDSSSSCPADQPMSCPSTAPSYANDVAPLLEHYCTSQCHNSAGSASDQPLSTYNDVKARLLNVESQIYQCRMPLPPITPPTLEQRVTLLTWFTCGAPDN
jgi:hypothetical protein